MKRLTDYQSGSIFGAVIVGLTLTFAFWGLQEQPTKDKRNTGTSETARDRNEPETFWGWTTKDPAGFFTFCLVVVGCAQAVFFVWQLDLIRRGLTDTKEAADAAKEAARIARLSLEAAETPYLVPIVRSFDDKIDRPPPSPSVTPLGSYAFENCGRSPATILEVYIGAVVDRQVPRPIPFPPPQGNTFHTSILAPGKESVRAYVPPGIFGDIPAFDPSNVEWIAGQVRYADVFGNQFLTGFCFYRNRSFGHWNALGTPAHNYRRKLSDSELIAAVERDRWPEHHWRN